MKLKETDFYKERFSLGSSRLKVYYGIDKLSEIMTKPAVSIIFENDSQLLLRKKIYELYPQYKTGKGKPIQLTLNFE